MKIYSNKNKLICVKERIAKMPVNNLNKYVVVNYWTIKGLKWIATKHYLNEV